MIHKPIKITDPINCKIRWANFRDFGVFGLHWQKKMGFPDVDLGSMPISRSL
jgi:hypothetical protein